VDGHSAITRLEDSQKGHLLARDTFCRICSIHPQGKRLPELLHSEPNLPTSFSPPSSRNSSSMPISFSFNTVPGTKGVKVNRQSQFSFPHPVPTPKPTPFSRFGPSSLYPHLHRPPSSSQLQPLSPSDSHTHVLIALYHSLIDFILLAIVTLKHPYCTPCKTRHLHLFSLLQLYYLQTHKPCTYYLPTLLALTQP
jgi:hypothetical protein